MDDRLLCFVLERLLTQHRNRQFIQDLSTKPMVKVPYQDIRVHSKIIILISLLAGEHCSGATEIISSLYLFQNPATH